MSNFFDRFTRMTIVAVKQLQDPYYHGFAAQISFYLILSIVPLLLLITQVLGMFGVNMETAVALIQEYTGYKVSKTMKAVFEFNSLGAGNIIFMIIAFWAGSRASFSIARISNYTLSEGKTTGRNYFLERARAIGTTMFTVATFALTIIILAYGRIIMIGILDVFNLQAEGYVDSIWMYLRWPLGFLLYLLMVSVNYYILPVVKMEFVEILPGSIFAALGMWAVTYGYSIYTSSLVHYDIMYGALSSVVAIMMWFLLISWVIILGVLVNKVWKDTSKPFSKHDQPHHLNIRGAWRNSKYDIDPHKVGILSVIDIILGRDIGEQPAEAEPEEKQDAEEDK